MRSGIYFFIFILISCHIPANGQIITHKEVPFVRADDSDLKFPLMGGMNNIQANEMDVNLDGILDLILFDRVGNVIIPMIYQKDTKQYKYEPEYKHIFPVLKDWVIFKDYNKDGLVDIFACADNTEGVPGIEVYTAHINSGKLEFKKFDIGMLFKILYFYTGGAPTNIPTYAIDLPTIEDMDGDGDLDIAFFFQGSNTVAYFQNVVEERGYGPDTLAFVFADNCYGGFTEDASTSTIYLSGSPDTCSSLWNPSVKTRHSGSTVLSVDLNGDDLKDMLIGDLLSNGVTALYNGGNQKKAWMNSQRTDWPGPLDSVNLVEFDGMFSVDIDHDQLLDVIISPNDPGLSENVDNVWYYRNTGTLQNPKFQLQTKNLFASEMIGLGAGSDPCFVDYNQDGLMDILVGTQGYFIKGSNLFDARLVLFENIGTKKFPKYKLVDSNYLNFREFVFGADTYNSFSPCFGDLDNDGDLDLLVGEKNGQFFYCENIAGKGMPFKFNKPVYPYKDLSVNVFSSPVIVDLNRDGLPDIVSGSKQNTNDSNNKACGSFYYFQNKGSIGHPDFEPDYFKSPNTNCLGKIIVNGNNGKSYTSPEILDFNGIYKLFSGNYFGEVKIISNIENNVHGQFQFENENYGQLLEGERSRISLADIDDDGILDMVVGNSRGGLAIFGTTIRVDGTTNTNQTKSTGFVIFPNPSTGLVRIANNEMHDGRVTIFSIQGKLLNQFVINSNSVLEKDLAYLNKGMYIISIQAGSNRQMIKWIKN